jgi:hypothetical protein
MRGYELSTRFHARLEQSVTYHVTLWQQPFLRWLVAKAYHCYDMNIYRLPGFKLLENALLRIDDIPLGAKQDIRCHFLTRKKRTEVVTFEVTKEKYDQLRTSKYD